MRRPTFVGLALLSLSSCGSLSEFRSQRRPDGAYQVDCKTSLALCLDRVEDVCGKTPFEVLSARDNRHPIDIAVGTYQREIRSSEAVIRCTKNKALFGDSGPAATAAASPPEAPPAPPSSAKACVPGATQPCVGPAACSGGQACLPDGSGFGACDCGAPRSPSDGGLG